MTSAFFIGTVVGLVICALLRFSAAYRHGYRRGLARADAIDEMTEFRAIDNFRSAPVRDVERPAPTPAPPAAWRGAR